MLIIQPQKELKNLKKAGLDRKDNTKVIYSHFHPDHIGWTSIEENGKRILTFPNAEYYCSENEWDFWTGRIGEPLSVDLKAFKEPLEGIIKFVKDGQEIIPNLILWKSAASACLISHFFLLNTQ